MLVFSKRTSNYQLHKLAISFRLCPQTVCKNHFTIDCGDDLRRIPQHLIIPRTFVELAKCDVCRHIQGGGHQYQEHSKYVGKHFQECRF